MIDPSIKPSKIGFPCVNSPANRTLLFFCAGMVVITVLALLVSRLNIGFPLFNWMLGRHLRFSDWTDLYRLAPQLPDPALPQLYSPPVDVLGRIAAHRMSMPMSAILFYFLPIFVCLLWLCRLAKSYLISFLVTCSYPCLFAIARGNMEIELSLLIFVALMSLFRGRETTFFVLIFLASLAKPFALAFLMIIARDHPVRILAVMVASAAANLFLLYLLGHADFDALPRYFSMVDNYKQTMALGGIGDLFNNSSYTIGKLAFGVSNQLVLYASALLSAAIVGMSYLLACHTLGVFSQVDKNKIATALAYGTIFYFPLIICWSIPVSADYRLNYFLMSVYFLIIAGDYFFRPRAKLTLLGLYFLIMVPKHFAVFGLSGQFHVSSQGFLRLSAIAPIAEITLQSLINPLLMLVVCAILALGLKTNIDSGRRYFAAPSH